MDALAGRQKVRKEVLLVPNVDSAVDMAPGVLISESAVDDLVPGDLRRVLPVDEVLELNMRVERRTKR